MANEPKDVRGAISQAVSRLAGTSDTPRLDAELLMAHALGVAREEMLLGAMRDPAPPGFEALIERRASHEPVAYITGRRDFWSITLAVSPDVLIPRPDSETLIEAALEYFGEKAPRTILDLGTGSGALLLAALDRWPEARGLGTDRSPAALACARANAEDLGLARRGRFIEADWGDGIDERFDLVLCNPPYVASDAPLPPDITDWEPAEALYSGADGLDACRKLAPLVPRLLEPGGLVCIEIGDGQEQAASALFSAHARISGSRRDLGGHVRCLMVVA